MGRREGGEKEENEIRWGKNEQKRCFRRKKEVDKGLETWTWREAMASVGTKVKRRAGTFARGRRVIKVCLSGQGLVKDWSTWGTGQRQKKREGVGVGVEETHERIGMAWHGIAWHGMGRQH